MKIINSNILTINPIYSIYTFIKLYDPLTAMAKITCKHRTEHQINEKVYLFRRINILLVVPMLCTCGSHKNYRVCLCVYIYRKPLNFCTEKDAFTNGLVYMPNINAFRTRFLLHFYPEIHRLGYVYIIGYPASLVYLKETKFYSLRLTICRTFKVLIQQIVCFDYIHIYDHRTPNRIERFRSKTFKKSVETFAMRKAHDKFRLL